MAGDAQSWHRRRRFATTVLAISLLRGRERASTLVILMACPSCSRPTPDGARFCPHCGHALAPAQRAADEERRVVTVLFADVVGFTSLAEQRDPEQVKRLVDAVFQQLVADVERHGGVVDKVLGDGIVALFGAPVAHEDDADRAVRAGLTMQATLGAFCSEHPADAIQMRVGINTGEVLVGTLAGTEYTALGDVVNTAARLQELCPAGAVLVGDATRALCSRAVRFRRVEALRLRGREQQVEAWQAVAVDSSAVGRRWQSDVELVGRDVEQAMLRAVASTVASGRSAIVAVAGEAGIGKTRLVHEVVGPFLAGHPEALLIEGACAPYGEPNVWWPLVAGVLSRLGLDRSTPASTARELIELRLDGIEALDAAERHRLVEVTLHLLGHPSALDGASPAANRDQVLAGIVTGLGIQARLGPVVVWIDDLQWASHLFRELLVATARALADQPLLVVATYRPTEDDPGEWPPPSDPALSLHLPLAPLGDRESALLVARAAERALPDAVTARIAARSGGNPLFLIELARLASSGDGPADLPGSLRALIAARLDALTPSQRAIVDNAAILGNQNTVSALAAFAEEMRQDFTLDDLRVVEGGGLIVVDGGDWRFRSDVVREVAYSTLTKQARAQRHAGVARYLLSHEKSASQAAAHHVATAAELVAEIGQVPGVPSDVGEQALAASVQAANAWYRQGAYRRGLEVVERGLALATASGPGRRELLHLQAVGLVEQHQLAAARSALDELAQLAADAGDRVMRAEVFRLRGQVEQADGDLDSARRELGQAIAELRDLGDDEHLGEALRARGFAEIRGGSLTDAEWFLGEADDVFARIGDDRGRAWVLQHRAWLAFLSGDHAQAEAWLASAASKFEGLDDRAGSNWSRGLLAYVHHFAGRETEADELAASVLDEARRWGDDWGAAMMQNLRAAIKLWAGDVDEARQLGDRALATFRRLEDRFGVMQTLGTMSRVYVALGHAGDADRTSEELLVLSGYFGQMAYPTQGAAGTAMHLGQGARARELAADAIARLDATGANFDEARVVAAFGHLLDGDADAALAELLEVDVERSPFALAARATALVLVGDREGALVDVARQREMASVTYWDRTIADVAAAAAGDGSDLSLLTVPDVVLAGYVAAVLGTPDDAPIGQWADLAARLAAAAIG